MEENAKPPHPWGLPSRIPDTTKEVNQIALMHLETMSRTEEGHGQKSQADIQTSQTGGTNPELTMNIPNQPNNLIYRLTDQHLQVWQPKDHEEQVRAKMLGARNNNNQKKYWTGFSKRPPLMDL